MRGRGRRPARRPESPGLHPRVRGAVLHADAGRPRRGRRPRREPRARPGRPLPRGVRAPQQALDHAGPKNEAGHATATRLAMVADVIVENFSAGVMRRLKLDYDTLSPGNPRLIFISLSGYGHTGPRSAWTSMNMTLQAYTGLMLTTGEEGDPPTAISNSWNDYIGGLHGTIAVLQALGDRADQRSRAQHRPEPVRGRAYARAVADGRGGIGAAPQALGQPLQPRGAAGRLSVRRRRRMVRGQHRDRRPVGGAGGGDGQPALARDERYATASGRLRQHDAIDAAIAAWTRERSPVRGGARATGRGGPRSGCAARTTSSPRRTRATFTGPSPAPATTAADTHGPVHVQPQRRDPAQRRVQARRAHPRVLRAWLQLDDAAITALDEQRALV